MIKKILGVFFSLETMVVLSLVFLVAQISATLMKTDTDAWVNVYGTLWFEIIMWLLGLNLIGVLFKYKSYRKIPVFVLHLSLLIILLGAAVTRYFGYEGQLFLRNGEVKSEVVVIKNKAHPSDKEVVNLGFKIKLDKFVMRKYPGSMQPSSYDSYVTVIDGAKSFPYHIYMNHILVYKGYRFYQASYFPDEQGSILSVNHDPGMWLTYIGYALLAIGFFWSMLYRKSRFMMTVKKLQKSGLFAFIFFFLLMPNVSKAMSLDEYAKNSLNSAKEFSKILVQQNGRIKPMDTLDLDVIHKITKKAKLLGMNYNQLITGMLSYPEVFQNAPLIYVGHPAIRKELGISGKYAPYNVFFGNDGNLKYSKDIDEAFNTPDKDRTKVQREWIKLNERIYVSYLVFTGQIFKIYPTPNAKNENYKWYSPFEIQKMIMMKKLDPFTGNFYVNEFASLVKALRDFDAKKVAEIRENIYKIQKEYSAPILPDPNKIKWELRYNHWQIFPSLIGVYLLLGIILIFIGFAEILKEKRFPKIEKTLYVLGVLALIVHTANMLLRWYIAGHAPWSDAYESIVFIAWGSAFASLIFFRKSMLALGAGLFVAGMFMMVAHLNNIDPQITNMVPVLKSYWLLIHVAVITSSYGFLGVGSMLGALNLILFALKKYKNLDNQIKQLNNIIYIALYIGLALLSIGTFLGGVWANESWGRYWSWDPKETWSLITMIVYALVIHGKMIPKLRGEFIFSLLSFLSFFFVLMTYFGVNFYIAQGLHSYGQGTAEGYWWINVIFAGMGAWFAVVIVTLIMGILSRVSKPVRLEDNEYHPKG
ncbi:cytochrome c biogenesis protein CcsA [Nautilia sp.]